MQSNLVYILIQSFKILFQIFATDGRVHCSHRMKKCDTKNGETILSKVLLYWYENRFKMWILNVTKGVQLNNEIVNHFLHCFTYRQFPFTVTTSYNIIIGKILWVIYNYPHEIFLCFWNFNFKVKEFFVNLSVYL